MTDARHLVQQELEARRQLKAVLAVPGITARMGMVAPQLVKPLMAMIDALDALDRVPKETAEVRPDVLENEAALIERAATEQKAKAARLALDRLESERQLRAAYEEKLRRDAEERQVARDREAQKAREDLAREKRVQLEQETKTRRELEELEAALGPDDDDTDTDE